MSTKYMNQRLNNHHISASKWPPYWNYASGFDFDPFTVVGMLFCIRLNYIRIRPSTVELWRHSSFQDAVSHALGCWQTIREVQSEVSVWPRNFDMIWLIVFANITIINVSVLAWNRLFTPTFRTIWGPFPPNDVTHHPNSKMLVLARIRRLSHNAWKPAHIVPLMRRIEKTKRTWQTKNHTMHS